jgi:3-keto-5-aminohexanoate cleavage enzyme
MTDKEFEGYEWAEMVFRSEINPTMNKKLVITVCPVGALVSRKQNPNQPRSPKEIAGDTIASYREGASVAHLHNRNEYGHPVTTTELLKETIERILDACPDMIIQPSAAEGYVPEAGHYTYETTKPMAEALHGISRNYMESTIFTPVSYALRSVNGPLEHALAVEDNTVKTVSFLQDNDVKPEFMCHNWEGIMNVKEWLIKPGILQKPYLMTMGPGMHNAAETYPDPWGLLYVLGMIKMIPEGSVIGLSAGGRNWLPLTVFGILMGVDNVRVGLEDHIYMYPHKSELIKSSADEARKIATIARALGRDVATPAEARQILGIGGHVT